jgi:hypothetical protein
MTAITDRGCRTRQMARALFPQWSRAMRARWVLAKLRAPGMRVAVSSAWPHDANAYRFGRLMK